MKKIVLGQTLAILANVGVLAGILLLVFELSQNREMMTAQTRNEISQGAAELLTLAINDVSFQNVIRRGQFGEELSEDEQWQFYRYQQSWLRYWENVHYQYRIGLFDETEFAYQKATWAGSLSIHPGIVKHWCERKAGFSPEFVTEIDGLLTFYQCE